MTITTATKKDIENLKKIWVNIFGDSEEFAQFAVNICSPNEIYLVKDNENIAAMAVCGIDVFAYGKKGFYIYGVATLPEYRNKGYAKNLIAHICDLKFKSGYDFSLTQPANKGLFSFYEKLGFDTYTYLRKCDVNIKRNIWAKANFDTATATRFPTLRSRFSEDEVVHFSSEGYEKFAQYIYTEGGSTAETENAFCIYFIVDETILVRELFAKSTADANFILQAVREQTGKSSAVLQLSKNSSLFTGMGEICPHCLVKNLNEEIYANMMFD